MPGFTFIPAASSLFPGPCPPILSIAGGSMGFLTPFTREEMVEAVRISLGLYDHGGETDKVDKPEEFSYEETDEKEDLGLTKINAGSKDPIIPEQKAVAESQGFELRALCRERVCLSMRMRLDCHILNKEGVVRARFSVLNELCIDRGSSPYLANLECYCDDVHLTTVQADGVIFST